MGKSKQGGARPGAGRKPNAMKAAAKATQAARVTERGAAADYAWALYCEVMQDTGRNLDDRLDAAKLVLAYAWGKPKQVVEVPGRVKLLVLDV